ncbi:MAG: GNAT family N-acetyltransferase [Phycisphaerales bacterium]|nr:GNAT family N-acetyltransferase [Phycisphaerales bacterium]
MTQVDIRYVGTPAEIDFARALFREYQQSLQIELCFQSFEEELANLPGKFTEPHGCILLARCRGQVAGCVAMRPLSDAVCEMKRLFVRPSVRGAGVGRALAERILQEARGRGFVAMRLDTIPAQMPRAAALYRSMGFVNIPAYYEYPIAGAEYFELRW